MEMKWVMTLMLAMTMVIFEGDLIMGNVVEVKCIGHCMKDCKKIGIATAACLKFCPLHCVPLPPLPLPQVHYCNVRCILERCIDYKNEEEKLEGCASTCRNINHC